MLRDFLRAVGLILGSAVAAQVVVVAASPVLSRLYSPSDFGILATASGVISILAIGASLRLEEVLPLIRSDRVAELATGLGLAIAVLLGLLLLVPVYLFGRSVGIPGGTGILVAFAACVSAAVALAGCYSTLMGARLRRQSFSAVARANVEKVFVQLAIQLTGGFAGLGALPLLIAKVAEKGVGIRRLWTLEPPATSRRSAVRALRAWRPIFARYRDLIGFGLLAALSRALRIGVIAPLIAVFWGVSMAGIFALANRALAAPFMMAGGASLQAFLGVTGRNGLLPSPRLRRLLVQATVVWALGSALTYLALARFAEPSFAWAFGEEWRAAGEIAPYLGVMGGAFAFSMPLQRLYDLWGLVRTRLVFEATQSVVVVGVLVFSGLMKAPLASAMAFVAGVALASALATVIHLLGIRPSSLPGSPR